jgi:processive 1,2-diacylglycerol beta-glucosyltransferase
MHSGSDFSVSTRVACEDSPRRILIVTASVGAGHNQAARALVETLRRNAPEMRVECRDVLDYVPRRFRLKYAGGYAMTVSRFPRFYGIGYAITDHPRGPGRTLMERRRLWSEARVLGALGRAVDEFRPDTIVHTHFLAPPYLARRSQRRGEALRQFIVTTDVLPHRWWYCEGVQRYFTAHEPGRARLIELGAPEDRIVVSGMPIHPKWTESLPPREEICREWSLPADRPIVLLSGGTDFTCGPIVKIARRLTAGNPSARVVVLGGRNKKLLGKLSRLSETREGRIIPQGFTDRVHELASVAEVMLTKAGGLTTAECLAKRLPMVFLPPVPGQERHNAEFFAQHGAGKIARNVRQVIAKTTELLHSPEQRQAMSRAAGELYSPGAQTIIDAIL